MKHIIGKRKATVHVMAYAMILAILVAILSIPQSSNVSAGDYTNAGCVSWVKDRTRAVMGIELPATGNQPSGVYGASNYWYVLPNKGYATGNQPRKHALAVWRYTSGTYREYGHVAFVEDVNGDNVTVTEGGCAGYSYAGNTGVICRTVTKAQMATLGGCSGFLGYVYLEGSSSATDLSYSALYVEALDSWNALLYGKIENPGRATVSDVGVQIWDSTGTRVVHFHEGCGLNTSVIHQRLNIVEEALPQGLNQGAFYTFQMYAIANGVTYTSIVGSFTVPDIQNPVITDVTVSNVTKDGYTVSCKATDNFAIDRVQFPTWTVANDQDDITSEWWNNAQASGKKNGDTYTYRVNISDHNNETGLYSTHIYAYDRAGNRTLMIVPNVTITTGASTVVQPKCTITYDPNGGTGTPYKETSTKGATVALRQNSFQAPSGKQFKCWALGSINGIRKNAGATCTFQQNTSLYAIWENLPPKKEMVTSKKITLNKNKVTVPAGKSTILMVKEKLSAGSSLKWVSSNSKIVSVNHNGKIVAKRSGVATITVTLKNGGCSTCRVTVAKVVLKKSSGSVKKGKTIKVAIKSCYPKKDSVKRYVSANSRIAAVDSKGRVKGKKRGKTTITVIMKSGARASYKVTVK